MILYAESSAVLAWLLEERDADAVHAHLSEAELVFASELTGVECDRVLCRAVALAMLPGAEAAGVRAVLGTAMLRWNLLQLSAPVLDRARRPFPMEPVRTLDALHVASTIVAAESLGPPAVLSLDERVRGNASALGFEVLPARKSH